MSLTTVRSGSLPTSTRLCQALGQCRRAKKPSEQLNSERAKNGGRREGEEPVSVFLITSICPPSPLSEKQMSKLKSYSCSTCSCLVDSMFLKPMIDVVVLT